MVNGNSKESVMIDDVLDELIDMIIDIYRGSGYPLVCDVDKFLTDAGFMIVPIEDPTNLRFGVDDEAP